VPDRDQRLKWLGVADTSHTFEAINPVRELAPIIQAFRDIARGTADFYMLMVCGGSGNGKTHLCEAAVMELHDRRLRCPRKKWSDIIRHLKAGFRAEIYGDKYEDRFDRLRSIPRLIIDDVGMGSTGGNWEWGELEDIIDYRMENKLLTVVTTNLDLKQIPPRVVSRFRDGSRSRIMLNEAADYRPKMGER